MVSDGGIIHACTIEGDGKGLPLTQKAVSETIKDDKLAWVHLDANHAETRHWLKNEMSYLDTIIIDALLAEETRPRIVEFDEGALMILRGVNLNENAQPEDMISIRLWIDSNRIISLQRRPLKATKDIQNRLIEGKGPKNSGDFIVALASRLFERMEPIFSELDENLDDIEERIMEIPDTKERQEITSIRKQAIIFRRYIAPQRDVISYLRTSEQSWLDQSHKRRLQEALDRVIRYIEDLDTIRERAQIVKDELANALADKMNKNMYVLSVIAAIFLPLGFLTGLLGINVGGIPGTNSDSAFFIFSGLLAIIVLVQVILFKKFKWF
ncbi:MAG: zinc transporter ZntB [Alphaproteobacteria bacterium]|nr:zinc transporter ZntB [Alphaproteobacteria bacterium]